MYIFIYIAIHDDVYDDVYDVHGAICTLMYTELHVYTYVGVFAEPTFSFYINALSENCCYRHCIGETV